MCKFDINKVIEYGDYDSFLKSIASIVEVQNNLNTSLCGSDYSESLVCAKTDKPIRYGNALISESAELLDSTAWKHWSSKLVNESIIDYDNIGTELIDIGHFIASAIIVWLGSNGGTVKNCNDEYSLDFLDIVKVAWDYIKEKDVDTVQWNPMFDAEIDPIKVTTFVTSHVSILGGFMNLSPDFNLEVPVNVRGTYLETTSMKTQLGVSLGMMYKAYGLLLDANYDTFAKYYYLKNSLNILRDTRGYNGEVNTYHKIWNIDGGLEDNVVAKQLIDVESTGQTTMSKVYELLETYYDDTVLAMYAESNKLEQ